MIRLYGALYTVMLVYALTDEFPVINITIMDFVPARAWIPYRVFLELNIQRKEINSTILLSID